VQLFRQRSIFEAIIDIFGDLGLKCDQPRVRLPPPCTSKVLLEGWHFDPDAIDRDKMDPLHQQHSLRMARQPLTKKDRSTERPYRKGRIVPTYPLLKLSDVIVVRHASSSTRLKTARYHLARLVRASPRCRQRDGPGR